VCGTCTVDQPDVSYPGFPEEVWPDAPPKVPRDVNPTGAYLKSFDIPSSEAGRRQLVRFEGVTSGYFVWVNGKYAGYDQGGYSPAEFDVTDLVKPGRNTLAVQVHRWGSGSYLEDYDQWRYAGIFRDVYSYSVPQARIQDAYVTTDLDAAYKDATLAVGASVEGAGAGYQVSATLRDPRGGVVTTLTGAAGTKLSGVVSNPAKWSDETPTLYSLVLALSDPSGKVVHRTSQKIGFREIEVRDKQVLLNGKRILFRGVNRSETDPDTGRHITHAAMEKDVQLMKKLHVNAVRTSHYESDPYWYELADRYGLLIDDEVDIETHAHESCPSVCLASKPEWQAAYHDRFVAMVERDKNHPSVVFWDTGNEAGLGAAHFAMAEWADANEPTRLLYHQSNSPDGDAPYADVAGPRYPTPASLENKVKTFTKPIVMGEYAHAMGNGLGNFDQFWALARKYPSMQGGFIWDWAEQNLAQPLKLTPDSSPRRTQAFFVGKPALASGHQGKGVELSSLDDFVDVFRDPALDVTDGLTLDAWVKPGSWTGSFPILTKGQQYALQMPNATTLEFRVTLNGQQKTVTAPVPADWLQVWHRVTGTYDGASLVLSVDGVAVAQAAVTGKIEPGLWEVNVGRNAETQQDQVRGRIAHGIFDQIRILPRAMTSDELRGGVDLRSEAVLALDFEQVADAGRFQSLGISLSGTDGLVGTDRYLQPETAELAWAQSPLRFSSTEPGVVTVRNEQQFAPLVFDLRWAVRQADAVIRQGSAPLTLPPDSEQVVRLPVAADNPRSLERFLSLDAASGGVVLQRDQFRLGGTVVAGVGARPAAGKVAVSGTSKVVVSGKDFRYTFDQGALSSLVARGKELLKRGPELDVCRPPTSNETYDWGTADRQVWNEIGLDRLQTTRGTVSTTTLPDGRVQVTVPSKVAAPGHADELSFDQTMTYTIDALGAITLAHQVTPHGSKLNSLPYLPRVGFSLQVPDALSRFAYYGRGPEESYSDRASGTRVGVYRSSVEQQYVRYSRPQAYGNHTDTRWTSLTDTRNGVLVAAAKGDSVDVSVTQYDRLDRAEYDFQRPLVRNKDWVTLHVEDAETGMGETPNGVQAPYKIDPNQPRSYSVTLRPLSSSEAATGAPAVTGPPACDPTTVVQLQGEAKQGEPQTVQVTVTGECAVPVGDTSVALAAPEGWKVEPASVVLGDVAAQQTKTATFTVTPAVTAGFGSYNLVATTSSDQGVVTASARVELPLAPGQRWASDLPFAGTPTNGWVRSSGTPATVRTSVVTVVRCGSVERPLPRDSVRTPTR
jgi:beta-galactosidase